MQTFAKPIVVASKCLEFAACRFNGQTISDAFVRSLRDYVDFITVCPEVEIGLGAPREPVRVVSKADQKTLFQPATCKDFTSKMENFSRAFLGSLDPVDGFILKGRSPSCGPKGVRIYSEKGSLLANGSGFFGQAVVDKFPGLAAEEEGRLRNFRIREHFLTKLFTLARFREVKCSNSMNALVDFQADNKLVFMTYNQKTMRAMGRIVANPQKRAFHELIPEYEAELKKTFARMPKIGSNINVLLHAFGYFSKRLSKEEKAFFLDLLEKYRELKSPLSAVLSVLNSWIARFDQKYLARQTFFEPYPEALREISDSGKGRDLP